MGSYFLGDTGSLLGLTAGGLWGLHLAESCAFLLKPQHWRNEEAPEKGYSAMFSESKGTFLPASKRPWLSRILRIKSDKSAPPGPHDTYSLEEIHRRLKEINSQLWRELRIGVLSSCHKGLHSVRLDDAGQSLNWREVNRLTVSALHRLRSSLMEALDRIGQKLQLVQKAALRKADRLSKGGTMAQRQKPEECRYFPFCESLGQMLSELLPDAEKGGQILPTDAETICVQCHDFLPSPK
jgi:hypothetical protein